MIITCPIIWHGTSFSLWLSPLKKDEQRLDYVKTDERSELKSQVSAFSFQSPFQSDWWHGLLESGSLLVVNDWCSGPSGYMSSQPSRCLMYASLEGGKIFIPSHWMAKLYRRDRRSCATRILYSDGGCSKSLMCTSTEVVLPAVKYERGKEANTRKKEQELSAVLTRIEVYSPPQLFMQPLWLLTSILSLTSNKYFY